MNSKQRIAAAMNHQTPDRVPVMCQLALGHYFLNCTDKPSEIWFDGEVFAKVLVERQQKYGFDGILVNLPGRPPDWMNALTSREQIDDIEHLRWKSGSETIFGADDNPQTYQPDRKPPARADYTSVDVGDPATYRLPGYVWNTWHAPELWGIDPQAELSDPAVYPAWFTNTLTIVQQLAPEVSIHAEVFSPFTHLMELFGYEQALLALVDAPQICHELLGVLTQNVLVQIELYAGCQPDAILVSSAFAGAGFISRRMYREFVIPYEDRVFRAIRGYGLKSYVHTCGAIGDRLDLMSKTAVDGIDTLDPPPLGTVYLEDAKSKYGERFFFKGNLDAVNEMLSADDQTFEKAVKERIRIGKPGSGYILSSACSVAPHVNPERLKRLAVLATQFGKY
ncbi:MAG TPA: uroporphyrinogen decarboxylase family protein [Sedimentisphaerales bacterium]|nr:uroporphyrinogen decarboxylase family protein [Sedimentisphaerales bacterium]